MDRSKLRKLLSKDLLRIQQHLELIMVFARELPDGPEKAMKIQDMKERINFIAHVLRERMYVVR